MKFTTLIPTTRNDGTRVKPSVLDHILDSLWRPFRAMTKEGYVTGHWIDDDGTEFTDVCLKVFIDCDRSRLFEAIKAVRPVGRRLGQRAMYFEVAGYDGVQILRIEGPALGRPLPQGDMMAAKKKPKVSPRIVAKARQVLEFAEQRAREAANWMELSNALFAPGGKATEAFATQAERTAFCKTQEYKRILALMDTLPQPPVKGFVEMVASANGAISVRLPRSVHAALLAEAKAEGVSLNQLCVAKLVAQLRAVV